MCLLIDTFNTHFFFVETEFKLDWLIMDMICWKRNINQRQLSGLKVNAFYSTPSCYLKSLYDTNISWPTKNDDFFPYASDPHSFWTGYFTSRPTLKRYERIGNHYLQVSFTLKIINSILKTNAILSETENSDSCV